MVRKFMLAAAAASLVLAPVGAQAAAQRSSSPVAADNEHLVGLLWSYVILPLVVAAVLAVVLGSNDDDMPTSP